MSDPIVARTEFAAALNQVANERGISPESILESIKTALLAAFRKDFPEEYAQTEAVLNEDGTETESDVSLNVELDSDNGEFRIIKTTKGSKDKVDVTPPGFGRIAAMTAKQVVMQSVRETEKTAILDEYRSRIGEVITALVLRLDGKNVILDVGRGQAIMPPEEQVRGEFYRPTSRIAILIADIRETFKGETIIASRADSRLVEQLFAREVPEVSSGVVVIKGIAREPGVRSKVAVQSTQDGVDPVGSCVGQKGVRVQAVITELNGERVDIIQYSDDPAKYLAAALAPADNLNIDISSDKKMATVTVPEDQLSLAIGRGGQNVKLAARLTGFKIKINGGSIATQTITGSEEYEIDLLGLDEKVRNKLVTAGVVLLEQLLGDDIARLKDIKGIGKKSVEEITNKLAAYQSQRPTVVEEASSETPSEEPSDEPKEESAATPTDTPSEEQATSETPTAE